MIAGKNLSHKKAFTAVEIISTLVILGILSAILVPRFINMAKEGKQKLAFAGIAEYNSREKVLWSKMFIVNEAAPSDDTALDTAIYGEMESMGFDLDSGTATDWSFTKNSGSPGADITATLNFKGEEIAIIRQPATLESPAHWSASGSASSGSGDGSLPGFSTITFLPLNGDRYNVDDEGTLNITGASGMLIEGTSSSDFEATVIGSLENGKGWGFFYRATPNNSSRQKADGYCFQVDPGAGDRFLVKDAHTDRTIASVKMKDVLGKGYDENAEFEIFVDVSGDQHTIQINGIDALSFSDNRYTEGKVGFRSWGSSAEITSFDFDKK